MKNENSLRLRHILDAIDAIEGYVHEVDEEQFSLDAMRHDAVIRQIEIIGEATTHLTDELRAENPDIPWKKIVGTRNRLIHGYTAVSLKFIWSIVKTELPKLKSGVERTLKDTQ